MALLRAADGSLVQRLFPAGSPQRLELLRAAWPLAVGADLARRTEVLALEQGTLRIRVPDARWRKVLHKMAPQILQRMREVAAEAAPYRLGFQDGGGKAAAAAAPPRPPRADGPSPRAPESVETEAGRIADPELRRLFIEAAGRYFSLERGGASPHHGGTPSKEDKDA
jgi:hypothetical protein